MRVIECLDCKVLGYQCHPCWEDDMVEKQAERRADREND